MNFFRNIFPLLWANSSKIEKRTFGLIVLQSLLTNINEVANMSLISAFGTIVTSGSTPKIYDSAFTFLSRYQILNGVDISPYRLILVMMALSFTMYGANLISFNKNKSYFASYWCHKRIKEKTSEFFNEDFLPHKRSNVNNLLNKLLIDARNVSAILIQPTFAAINSILFIILSIVYWLSIYPVTTAIIVISFGCFTYTLTSIINQKIRTTSKRIRILSDIAVNKIVETENLFGEMKVYDLLQCQIDKVVEIDLQIARAYAVQSYTKIIPGIIIQIIVICTFVLLLLLTMNPILLRNNSGYLLGAFYTVFKLIPTIQTLSRCLGSFAAGQVNLANLLSSDFAKVKLNKQ